MKQIFIQGMSHKEYIDIAKKSSVLKGIGEGKPIAHQVPKYKDIPMTYASHITDGYPGVYRTEGIIFTTESPLVYASPVDAWHYMRGGNWLPGHEKFLFNSLEEMLITYPTLNDFKKDFVEFFKNLTPEQVYPNNDKNFARNLYECDYIFRRDWISNLSDRECNEITFKTPSKIDVVAEFYSIEELRKKLCELN